MNTKDTSNFLSIWKILPILNRISCAMMWKYYMSHDNKVHDSVQINSYAKNHVLWVICAN